MSDTSPVERSQQRLRRTIVASTVVCSLVGLIAMIQITRADGVISPFDWVTLATFGLLFGWIVFSFHLAVLGFIRCRRGSTPKAVARDDREGPTASPSEKPVAVLMPIYNESPVRVMAGVEAMIESLRKHDAAEQFEFYVLSDSTRYEVWLAEEQIWSELCKRNTDFRIHYRHRPKNSARKAGNIADFCRRWGGHHDYMIVLDADSLIVGETMIEMRNRMDADDRIGILQVPPRPIGRNSLFARLQQFSAAVYGEIFIEGFAAWSGEQGNYWGHNAIIRIAPFCDHCELPRLPGDGPLGGEILSHDFVEAALMVRNRWKVVLAGDLSGSFEECPTTIMDYAIRDHRWCQGNLQHAKLLASDGFNPLSRSHFASGVMSYVASPIWVLFTLACIAAMIDSRYRLESQDVALGGAASVIAITLFAISMLLLLTPKLLAVIQHRRSSAASTRQKLWRSTFLEILCSIALSPIMAIYHTRFVFSTLLGVTVRWNAQERNERGVTFGEAVRQHWPMTVFGFAATIGLYQLSPGLTAWFSPLLFGLCLSIPIAVLMGSPAVGMWLRKRGLLCIEEERHPPQIELDCQRFEEQIFVNKPIEQDLFAKVINDPQFFSLHRGIQKATQSDIPLDQNQTKAVEAALSAGGATRIPQEVRRALLADSDTLMALHLESQI